MVSLNKGGVLDVSVVLPVYNGADRLERCVSAVDKKLRDMKKSYEIIIAEDGSTDGTPAIAAKLAKKNPRIINMHSAEKLGRGRALELAFKQSRGKIVSYMDVDLATDLGYFPALVKCVENGADFATGSRMKPGAKRERPLKREVASQAYNLLVRLLFNCDMFDMQCGFKAFRRDKLMELMGEITDKHWFWDTEFLLKAHQRGYKIEEIPVEWAHPGGSTVHVLRDAVYMGTRLVKLRLTM